MDTDSDVELLERPAPHPWAVLREHAALVPVIAVGGAIGSVARWAFAHAEPHADGRFAWATLWTNVSGAFLLGVLMAWVLAAWSHTRYVRPLLGVGVLGGYTTFSTYLLDERGMLAAGHPLEGFAYAVGTLLLGLVGVLAGLGLGHVLLTLLRSGRRR